LWQLFLPGGLVAGSFRAAASVREGWLEQSYRKKSVDEESLSVKTLSRHVFEVSR
jgi:hypothetical protein